MKVYATLTECEKSKSKISAPEQAIVFDWDDTLLPTIFLKKYGNGNMNKEDLINLLEQYESDWDEFDLFVSKFLKKLNRKSDLYIISNAKLNWIKTSCAILMPRTNKFLKRLEKNDRLISAREMYFSDRPCDEELIGKGTKNDWKSFTFFKVLSHYKTIISLGDAEYERYALFAIPNLKNKMVKKNIRLLKRPEMDELLDQLVYICSDWEALVKEDQKIDVDVFIKISNE